MWISYSLTVLFNKGQVSGNAAMVKVSNEHIQYCNVVINAWIWHVILYAVWYSHRSQIKKDWIIKYTAIPWFTCEAFFLVIYCTLQEHYWWCVRAASSLHLIFIALLQDDKPRVCLLFVYIFIFTTHHDYSPTSQAECSQCSISTNRSVSEIGCKRSGLLIAAEVLYNLFIHMKVLLFSYLPRSQYVQ